MTKKRTWTATFRPFKKEYRKPIATEFSSTYKFAAFLPKGGKCFNLKCKTHGKHLGNKYTRDLGEEFPTPRDAVSMYVRHERTHTWRNSEEFSNVTSNLKEYRKRYKPRNVSRNKSKLPRPTHSLKRLRKKIENDFSHKNLEESVQLGIILKDFPSPKNDALVYDRKLKNILTSLS